MKNKSIFIGLAVSALFIATLACGSSNAGVQVGTSSPATSAPVQIQIYRAGEVIQINTQTIVMNSAQINGGELQANFTVENKGTKDITVSSMLSFEAKGSDGTKLDQDIVNCPSGGLDGTIIAGDKLRGNLCWSGVTTNTVRIYYTPELFGSGATVWEVTR